MIPKHGLALVGLWLAATPCPAQRLAPVEYVRLRREALTLHQASNHAAALPLLRRLTAAYGDDGELWLALARSARARGALAEADLAFHRALDLGQSIRPLVAYEIAATHAMAGRRDSALAWVDRAISLRLERLPRVAQSEIFAAYRTDPRFRELVGLLPERAFTPAEGWRYDLDFLLREAQRLDPAPERRSQGVAFLTAIARLKERVPELEPGAVAAEIQRIVALLGAGHSLLWPVSTERLRFSRVPLSLYRFPEGLFVVGGEGDAARLVGKQVFRIGGRDAIEVLRDLAPYLSLDNPKGASWVGPRYATFPIYLRAIGAMGPGDSVVVGVADSGGVLRSVSLLAGEPGSAFPGRLRAPPGANAPPLWLRHPDSTFSLAELPEAGAVYAQVSEIGNAPGESFAQFAERVLGALAASGASSLILDLRQNGGGDGSLNGDLVRVVIHFEMQAPDHRVFVLMDRGTFSAAQNLVNALEQRTRATFVGEPTSSRPNFAGESNQVVLPWSGLRLTLSSRWFQDSRPQDQRLWVAPQVPVEYSVRDWLGNRDPVLEAVLAIVKERQ